MAIYVYSMLNRLSIIVSLLLILASQAPDTYRGTERPNTCRFILILLALALFLLIKSGAFPTKVTPVQAREIVRLPPALCPLAIYNVVKYIW